MLLGHIPLLELRQLREKIWLQAHRTRLYALCTLYTYVLLATCCLFAREYGDARASLVYRACDIYDGATHHRASVEELDVTLGKASCQV